MVEDKRQSKKNGNQKCINLWRPHIFATATSCSGYHWTLQSSGGGGEWKKDEFIILFFVKNGGAFIIDEHISSSTQSIKIMVCEQFNKEAENAGNRATNEFTFFSGGNKNLKKKEEKMTILCW